MRKNVLLALGVIAAFLTVITVATVSTQARGSDDSITVRRLALEQSIQDKLNASPHESGTAYRVGCMGNEDHGGMYHCAVGWTQGPDTVVVVAGNAKSWIFIPR